MKRAGIIGLAAFLFLCLQAPGYTASEKIGYVDLSRLFDGYPKTKEYDKILEEKQNKYEKEREKRVDKIKALQDKISLLSDQEKEKKRSELEAEIKKLQDFDRQQQTDLRKERDEKLTDILKDIEKAIFEYAKKEKYSLIFNDKVLMYQDKRLDVTDEVMELLKKKK